jgi:hypothetical protein
MGTINLPPKLAAGFNAQAQKSQLLQSLLASFTGTINITQPPDTGSFARGNNLFIDPALFPGSGNTAQELTWPQLVALIGHELAHAVLPYGNTSFAGADYVRDATSPDDSKAIGERSESEAYTAEYVIAEQLNDTSIFSRTAEVKPLFSMLNSDAKKDGLSVSAIANWGDLVNSSFYTDATGTSDSTTHKVVTVGNAGPIVDNLHISSNNNLTYKFFWVDQWILSKVYGLSDTNPIAAQ